MTLVLSDRQFVSQGPNKDNKINQNFNRKNNFFLFRADSYLHYMIRIIIDLDKSWKRR